MTVSNISNVHNSSSPQPTGTAAAVTPAVHLSLPADSVHFGKSPLDRKTIHGTPDPKASKHFIRWTRIGTDMVFDSFPKEVQTKLLKSNFSVSPYESYELRAYERLRHEFFGTQEERSEWARNMKLISHETGIKPILLSLETAKKVEDINIETLKSFIGLSKSKTGLNKLIEKWIKDDKTNATDSDLTKIVTKWIKDKKNAAAYYMPESKRININEKRPLISETSTLTLKKISNWFKFPFESIITIAHETHHLIDEVFGKAVTGKCFSSHSEFRNLVTTELEKAVKEGIIPKDYKKDRFQYYFPLIKKTEEDLNTRFEESFAELGAAIIHPNFRLGLYQKIFPKTLDWVSQTVLGKPYKPRNIFQRVPLVLWNALRFWGKNLVLKFRGI